MKMSLDDWSNIISIVGGVASAITAWAAITLVFLGPKKELTCYIGQFSETIYNNSPQTDSSSHGYHKYLKIRIANTGWVLTTSDFWKEDMARLCFIQNYEYEVINVNLGAVVNVSSQNPKLLTNKVYKALSIADGWDYNYIILTPLRLEKSEVFEIELRYGCHSKEELDRLTNVRIVNQIDSSIRVKIKNL